MTEWAVRVKWPDGWMWVTELAEGMDFSTPIVKTHATREAAERSAELWRIPGKEERVEVVEYDKNTK